jgi:hypothetical protein
MGAALNTAADQIQSQVAAAIQARMNGLLDCELATAAPAERSSGGDEVS